jgi:hypothetical protein
VGLHPNGFQDRPVMTASVSLDEMHSAMMISSYAKKVKA